MTELQSCVRCNGSGQYIVAERLVGTCVVCNGRGVMPVSHEAVSDLTLLILAGLPKCHLCGDPATYADASYRSGAIVPGECGDVPSSSIVRGGYCDRCYERIRDKYSREQPVWYAEALRRVLQRQGGGT